ncbi:choice-of-anchor A domain-containing protein [Stigmatella aurantiaca]|uniref:Choice-of-anchor A domain-containing protein n=2 Tax=Stigmatella aurantiaca TaxID=41 RepID=A0A1H8CNF5_STIAU|nr:choice-of-anchor A domain-containing protein [Stigmatella aurantiaca]
MRSNKQRGRISRWGSKARRGVSMLTFATLASCSLMKEDESQARQTGAAVGEGGVCEVQPPFTPNFEPELEWQWSGSSILPNHKQVMMTPVVVEVNGDGVPDVVFNSFENSNYTSNGVLRAVSGADGSELWTVTDPLFRIRGAASIAAGDIDGDGKVEICTVPENAAGIICFENDGTFKFRTARESANDWGGPSLADLDGDGKVEIIDGATVYTNTGALKWKGSEGASGIPGSGALSIAADIDLDGKLEVVADRVIYRHDGAVKCINRSVYYGLPGVANFDSDPYGEVVVVTAGNVVLMDDNCALLWSKPLPGGGQGGAPNIADFDNDGKAEVGVAGKSFYTVFDTNGAVLWSKPVTDASSNRTGSSTFDFEGDGKAEVVYADELRLRIYDGATGTVRFDVPNSSGTAYENPIIADVDGDDSAEILVVGNTYNASAIGLRVFRDKKDGWVNTRRIWNQHAYSVTGVNDDGTIPKAPKANWQVSGLNTFRSNSQGTGTKSAYAAPDLVTTAVTSACEADSESNGKLVRITAKVRNQGDAAISAGLPVAFYQGNPATGGELLGVTTVNGVLAPGHDASVSVTVPPRMTSSEVVVWAVADDNGGGQGRELECRENNNGLSAAVALGCTPPAAPDLVAQGVTAVCVAGGEGGSTTVSVSTVVRNAGNAPAAAGTPVAFYLGNPLSGGALLGVTLIPGPVGAGEDTLVSIEIAPQSAGNVTVYAVVDDFGNGQGREAESNETNNTASGAVSLYCAPPEPPAAPDVTAANVAAVCETNSENSSIVTVSAVVSNAGNAATSAGLPVAFYRGNPAAGGTLLAVTTLPEPLAAGAQAVASVQLPPQAAGNVTVYAVADDFGNGQGREAESNENNNATSASVSLYCAPPEPPAAPDLTATGVTAVCVGGSEGTSTVVSLSTVVRNAGNKAVAAGVPVAFYRGNPAAGGTLLGVTTVPGPLGAGEDTLVSIEIAPQSAGDVTVYAVADDFGNGQGRETESNETNNTASAPVSLSCYTPPPPAPDLTAANLTAACAAGSEGNNVVTLTATVRNQGNKAVAAGLPVTFYRGGTVLGVTTVAGELAAGAEATVTLQIASQSQGAVSVTVSADDYGNGQGREAESDETNNTATASVSLYCAPPEPPPSPDLTAANVAAACATGSDGNAILRLTATVRNAGPASVAAGLPVAFYRSNPATGGALLGVTTVQGPLAAGAEATVTLEIASQTGTAVSVFVVADDLGNGQGREAESNENNNSASATVNLVCAPPEPPECVELPLNDYNLFLTGDYTEGTDLEGRVAAGGNISMTNFSVGWKLPESDASPKIIAGGNLTLSNGSVWGTALYGGTYSASHVDYLQGGSASKATPVDFAARGAQLRALSNQLAGLPATGETQAPPWNVLTLQGTNVESGLEVFEVSAADLSRATQLIIRGVSTTSVAVVNVRGPSVTLKGGREYAGNNVLFNYVDATSITASAYGIHGTVLAPDARIFFSNGSWDGGIYAKSLTGNAEGHHAPLPNPGCPNNPVGKKR